LLLFLCLYGPVSAGCHHMSSAETTTCQKVTADRAKTEVVKAQGARSEVQKFRDHNWNHTGARGNATDMFPSIDLVIYKAGTRTTAFPPLRVKVVPFRHCMQLCCPASP